MCLLSALSSILTPYIIFPAPLLRSSAPLRSTAPRPRRSIGEKYQLHTISLGVADAAMLEKNKAGGRVGVWIYMG